MSSQNSPDESCDLSSHSQVKGSSRDQGDDLSVAEDQKMMTSRRSLLSQTSVKRLFQWKAR